MNRNQWGGEADKNIPHLNHCVWERVRRHRTLEEKNNNNLGCLENNGCW